MEEYDVTILFENGKAAKIENIPKVIFVFLKTIDKDLLITIGD
jgi:hypothetical protein